MIVDELREHRALLISYLLAKVKINDWHGVSDAANDLREIDVELRVLGSKATELPAP